jgi:hypothetical protein
MLSREKTVLLVLGVNVLKIPPGIVTNKQGFRIWRSLVFQIEPPSDICRG